MLVTLSGIVTLVRPLQLENALYPMLVTLSGIVTLVRPLQPENALSPMLTTPDGITISVRPYVSPMPVKTPSELIFHIGSTSEKWIQCA